MYIFIIDTIWVLWILLTCSHFYRFSASSDSEKSEWIECIQASIKEHTFYDIVEAKKMALKRKSLKHGSLQHEKFDHNVELLSTK